MTDTSVVTLGPRSLAGRGPRRVDPRIVLILVCVAHAVSPLFLVGFGVHYAWDEAVYLSQYSGHSPAVLFSPPRARGVPLLVAPVTSITDSVVAVRLYLVALSGIGMYLAYRPWQRLRPGYVVPLAAALFSTLWVVVLYGFQAMPNQYVAYGAMAATGWLLLARRTPAASLPFAAAAAVFVALVVTSFVRPTDAVFLAAPLVVLAFAPGGGSLRRRALLAGSALLGLAIGWAQWAYEAEQSFGGFTARLRSASENNRGGLSFAVDDQLRALGGTVLCKGPCDAHTPIWQQLWVLGLVALVVLAALAAWRRGPRAFVFVPILVGGSMAVPYLLLIDYAAPRFLTPTYAFLSLPCAFGAMWLVRRWSGARRRWVAAGLVAVLGVHVLVQLGVLIPTGRRVVATNLKRAAVGAWLDPRLASPCVVLSDIGAPATAYAAHCTNQPYRGRRLRELIDARRTDIAVVTTSPAPPGSFYAGWPVVKIDAPHMGPDARAYFWYAER